MKLMLVALAAADQPRAQQPVYEKYPAPNPGEQEKH